MAAFPSGTKLFFKNSNAPVGWTKDTSVAYDHGIRIVTGSAVGNNSGSNFSSTFTSRSVSVNSNPATLSGGDVVADVPAHTHSLATSISPLTAPGSINVYGNAIGGPTTTVTSFALSSPTMLATGGSSATHTHTITNGAYTLNPVTPKTQNFSLNYIDLILASKDATAASPYTFATQGITSIVKGGSVSFTVNTTGVSNGTVLYYTVFNTGFTGAIPSNQTGTFTINTNTSTFSVTIADNGYYDNGGKFIIQIRTGSVLGPIVASSEVISVTEPSNPTISFSSVPASIPEGSSGTFIISTSRIRNGTIINYTVNTLAISDVNKLSGNFSISNNIGSLIISPESDVLIEGNKSFTVIVSNTSIYSGLTITSSTITLADVIPTFTFSAYNDNNNLITPFPTSVDEGKEYKITITTTLIPNGSLLSYSINNTGNTSSLDWEYPTTGTTVVYNNIATFLIKTLGDVLTEPLAESFTISVVCQGITGTSSSIIINDTSPNPTFTFSPEITSITENQTITCNVTTTALSNTQFMWKINPISPALSTDFYDISGLFTTSYTSGTFNITTIVNTAPTKIGKAFTLNIFDSTGTINYTNSITPITITNLYSPVYEILTPINISIKEGNTLPVLILFTNTGYGQTLYWTINDTNSSDFINSSGSFTVTNTGLVDTTAINYRFINTLNITALSDYMTEGTESFTVSLRTGSITGPIIATSNSIGILDISTGTPTVSFTTVPATLNEDSIGSTFAITTTGFPSGYTGLYWTVNHITTNNSDFVAASGQITLSGATGSFTVVPTLDALSEGNETFTISIRNGGVTGNILATSSSVTIIDTSTSVNMNFVSPITALYEGTPVTYNISSDTNGIFYWDILNGTTIDSNFSTASGSFTVAGGVGSFLLNPIANSGIQGSRTFNIELRAGSLTGTILRTSPTITLNDLVVGQVLFETPGTATWTVPNGVTSICVLAIGAGGGGSAYGGGGGGGGLAYMNNLTVIPGTVYNLQVGAGGGTTGATGTGASWFNTSSYFCASAGGNGTTGNNMTGGGGGGAAGYAGNGGNGGGTGVIGSVYSGGLGGVGSGTVTGVTVVVFAGGTGGRGSSLNATTTAAGGGVGGSGAGGSGGYSGPKAGGGVGVYGQSSVDSFGNATTPGTVTAASGSGAQKNNGGSNGVSGISSNGENYGAGGSGTGIGGKGALRIIWGSNRAFPSTNTQDI
jgi:hypothetical protein